MLLTAFYAMLQSTGRGIRIPSLGSWHGHMQGEEKSMKRRYYSFVMFVALVFITTGGHAKDGPRDVSAGDMKEAVENFQGTWESVSVHRDGKPVEEQVGVRITVRDREVKVTEGGFVDIGG
jgi:hypothetical protein